MSDDTAPLAPPAAFTEPAPAPAGEASAIKSLLNPVQSGAATPSSTIVEAPRSPQRPPVVPAEPNGTAESTPAPVQNGGEPSSLPPLPADAPVPPSPKAADEPAPVLPPGAIPPAVSTPTVITEGGLATPAEPTPPPPATVDSLPPPNPVESAPAAVSPIPPPLAEPPAVPTPPVDPSPAPPAAVEPTPAPSAEPATATPVPAPSGLAEPAPTPAESTPAPPSQTLAPAPPISAQDSMDVDQPDASPANALKRSGDELEGREEKRAKETEPVTQAPAPVVDAEASASVPAPAAAGSEAASHEAPAPAPVAPAPPAESSAPPPAEAAPPAAAPPAAVPLAGTVPHVIPPDPEPVGPTTPLTQTQHKHMLASVRSLKKNKDAGPFFAPLDPILFGIPHYPQIITKPMDLSTVETKLIVSNPMGPPKDKSKMGKWDESKGKYSSVSEVALDVMQIRWNTERFNGTDHPVTQGGKRLEAAFIKMLNNMPSEPAPPAPIQPPASAGPSNHGRRPSVSHPPAIRRTSETTDRPKREIHPPPSKDLSYADAPPRKHKRRNDPQLQWAIRTLKSFESSPKTYEKVSPFLFPVEQIIAAFPDYAQVIKKPIDLNHVKARLDDGVYDDISQVTDDMNLIVSNALTYNPPHDPVAVAANALKQLWTEKLNSMPAKQESRASSEDPLAASIYDDSDDDEDDGKIAELQAQIADIQNKIEAIRSRQAKKKAAKAKKPSKKAGGSNRKQSLKSSPGTNGHAKKGRRPKDEDDEDEDSIILTQTQKSDLADKITSAEEHILSRAIAIIQKSQDVGSDGEIELDIESLDPQTLRELYVLVVGPLKKPRKSSYIPTGRKPGRKPGGPRKSMNEAEEAERIARMQAQLESFDGGRGGAGGAGAAGQLANGYNDDSDESSEEEDSDLE